MTKNYPTAQQTLDFFASLPRRRIGAGVLLTNGAGEVLMVEPDYKEYWEIPGGTVEAGEDPRYGCERECTEELGLDLTLGALLVIEHQFHPEPYGDSMLFVYDGGTLAEDAVITLPDAELLSYRFLPPDELESVTVVPLANRLRAALQARRAGTVVELVNGVRVN